MIVRTAVLGILVAAAGVAWAQQPLPVLRAQVRLHSPGGFSFLPPAGPGWTEKFDSQTIRFSKTTDPAKVTFYTQAVNLYCTLPRPGMNALLAFLRNEKDQWGSDGRFKPLWSSFVPDPELATCVRYQMSANDHEARNLGKHPFLILHINGRYCTHPQDPKAALDIAYSIRHVPGYDAGDLKAEGEAFLDTLAIDPYPAGARLEDFATRPCKGG